MIKKLLLLGILLMIPLVLAQPIDVYTQAQIDNFDYDTIKTYIKTRCTSDYNVIWALTSFEVKYSCPYVEPNDDLYYVYQGEYTASVSYSNFISCINAVGFETCKGLFWDEIKSQALETIENNVQEALDYQTPTQNPYDFGEGDIFG